MRKEQDEDSPNPFDTRRRMVTIEQALQSLSTIPNQEVLHSTLQEEWSNLIQLMSLGGHLTPKIGIVLGSAPPPIYSFPRRKYLVVPAGFDESIRYVPDKKAFYLHYIDSHGKRQLLDKHMSAMKDYINERCKEKNVQNPAVKPYTATTILFQSLAKPSRV